MYVKQENIQNIVTPTNMKYQKKIRASLRSAQFF